MASSLHNKALLYLDDYPTHLQAQREFFKSKGLKLETTNSVDQAKGKVTEGSIDLFLCDLKLDAIGCDTDGTFILNEIRSQNENVFLGLLTAYKGDLTTEKIALLKRNGIRIYDKEDYEEFILNLQSDFYEFQQKHLKGNLTPDYQYKIDFFDKYKTRVCDSLNKVSNKLVTLPIQYGGVTTFLSVNQLIIEVKTETEIGRGFVETWIDTLTLMEDAQNEK